MDRCAVVLPDAVAIRNMVLGSVLDKLPERFRNAIVMRKIDGLSVREISERTGAAEKTVEKHLTEGMRALADALYRDGQEKARAQ